MEASVGWERRRGSANVCLNIQVISILTGSMKIVMNFRYKMSIDVRFKDTMASVCSIKLAAFCTQPTMAPFLLKINCFLNVTS